MRKEDGGPAFAGENSPGMALRDYFAAKALAALISRYGADALARDAYQIADAMLVEREAER